MAKPKKFRGPELIAEIDEALDKGLARFLLATQNKLSAAAPVDTGRLASSWFVGKGVPNRDVPPEAGTPAKYKTSSAEAFSGNTVDTYTYREKVQGSNNPVISVTPYSGQIKLDSDWYISSNLPYSERACFDPIWAKGGRRGGAQWFTGIANNLGKDADRAFDFFLRKVK